MSYLLHNLLHFGRLLHQLGLDVHAGRMQEVARALAHIDIGHRQEFYHALRCLLVHRVQDLALFDEAFRVFWRRPHGEWTTTDLRAMGETRRSGPPEYESEAPPGETSSGTEERHRPTFEVERMAALTYSGREGLYAKDFAHFSEDEVAAAQRMMADLDWQIGDRRSKRWTPGRGTTLDLRRVVRINMRYGAELVDLPNPPAEDHTTAAHPDLRRERVDGALQPHVAPLRSRAERRRTPGTRRVVSLCHPAHTHHTRARRSRGRRRRTDPAAPHPGFRQWHADRRGAADIQS